MKTLYRDLFIALALVAFIAGCTLTGVRPADEVADNTQPATNTESVESTHGYDGHLGDPEFATEPTERKVNEGAVIARNPEAPVAIEEDETDTRNANLLTGIELYEQGRLRDARAALTAAISADLDDAEEREALAKLRAINEQIFLSAGPEGDLIVYRVKSGDTLARIASAHGTTWEMIQRINGLTTTRINVGQVLKVLSGKFELIVRKERFVMDLMLDGQFIQRYEVGLGIGGSTPLGEFTIKNRIPRPADGAYPFGHEKHRLGTRWLGLEGSEGYQGYGIHGCRPEEEIQIPGECSQGCVRMTNREVEEIFDIVPVGTRVVVVER